MANGQYVVAACDLDIPYVLSLDHSVGFEHYLRQGDKLPSLVMQLQYEDGSRQTLPCPWKIYGPGDMVPKLDFHPWGKGEFDKWKSVPENAAILQSHGVNPGDPAPAFLAVAEQRKIKAFRTGAVEDD